VLAGGDDGDGLDAVGDVELGGADPLVVTVTTVAAWTPLPPELERASTRTTAMMKRAPAPAAAATQARR
jgi:hypothetical protein